MESREREDGKHRAFTDPKILPALMQKQYWGGTPGACDFIVPITLRVISAVKKPLVFEATSHGV